MEEVKREVERLVNLFMSPIDKLHNYPMCFDTAVQCALIAIEEKLSEIPYFDPTDREINRRAFLSQVKYKLNKL